MKRLLITGLLGLTLINHVHAGSLTQYLPSAPAVKDFATGAAIAALPLVARAAVMVPYAYINEKKIIRNGSTIKQKSCAYFNPLTNVINRAKTAFEADKTFCQTLDMLPENRSSNTTNKDYLPDLAIVHDIETTRFALNTLVASISAIGLIENVHKITLPFFETDSDPSKLMLYSAAALVVSKLMTYSAAAIGFSFSTGKSLELCFIDDYNLYPPTVNKIGTPSRVLNGLVGSISALCLMGTFYKIFGFKTTSESKFVSKLITSNTTTIGFGLGCAASLALCLSGIKK